MYQFNKNKNDIILVAEISDQSIANNENLYA